MKRPRSPVQERLHEEPYRFDFVQAVRLLERRLEPRSRVGTAPGPDTERVRFESNPSLAFPASEIQDLVEDGPRASILQNFLGLVGVTGILPHFYSMEAGRELQRRKTADTERELPPTPFNDFLNIFQHRLTSLHYRAWYKSRPEVRLEYGDEDPIGAHALDLLGIPADRKGPIDTTEYLEFSPLLASVRRSASSLESLIEDFFDVPVSVESFSGAWMPLDSRDICRLDEDDERPANQLGRVVVGDEIWDHHSSVSITLGPLPLHQYRGFFPGRREHDRLAELLRVFGRHEFRYEVRLVLDRDEVPSFRLSADPDEGQPLGWCSWLESSSRDTDPDQTLLHFE